MEDNALGKIYQLRRIHQDPSLAYQIIQTMSRRIRELSQEVERLENWLLEIGIQGDLQEGDT